VVLQAPPRLAIDVSHKLIKAIHLWGDRPAEFRTSP
jgi:hypothetical protein